MVNITGTNITRWYDFPSNFSNGTMSVDGLGSFFQFANESVGGALGGVLLFVIGATSFVLMSGDKVHARLSVSLFITTFLAAILMRIGLVAVPIVFILAACTAISILFTRNESARSL